MNQKDSKILKLITLAKSLKGRPYKYGATMADAPRFFDCSLFIQYLFKEIDIALPRTAIEQAMVGKKVSFQKIQPGDLIFMKGEIGRYNKNFPKGIGHVGVYIGGGVVVHSERKRMIGKYEDLYHPERIKEVGSVVVESLTRFIKKKKPLITVKRYI